MYEENKTNNKPDKKRKGNRGGGNRGKRDNDSKRDLRRNSGAPDTELVSRTNDWTFHINDPAIMRQVGNIPFGWQVGSRLNLGSFGGENQSSSNLYDGHTNALNDSSIPGIMRIDYVAGIGKSNAIDSPVNIAAKKIYAEVFQNVSGIKNSFESTDLMMYILAMDQCLMFLQWCKRLYGVINLSNVHSRYYPMGLVKSMGVDWDDVAERKNELGAFINKFATQLNTWAVPAGIKLIQYHSWMTEGLYTDSTSKKAQMYYFNPEAFGVFELDNDNAGRIAYKRFPDNLMTVDDIIDFGSQMITPIMLGLGEQDFNEISTCILKSYGDNIVRATGIVPEYVVYPVHDEMVLAQIQNSTAYGSFDYSKYMIEQRSDEANLSSYLWSLPNYSFHTGKQIQTVGCDKIISSKDDEPKPEWVIDATRFTNIPYVDTPVDETISVQLTNPGSVILTNYYVAWYTRINDAEWDLTLSYPFQTSTSGRLELTEIDSNYYVALDSAYGALQDTLFSLCLFSQFDWHPFIYPGVTAGTTPTSVILQGSVGSIFGDVNNYAIVTEPMLAQINDAVIRAELGISNLLKL